MKKHISALLALALLFSLAACAGGGEEAVTTETTVTTVTESRETFGTDAPTVVTTEETTVTETAAPTETQEPADEPFDLSVFAPIKNGDTYVFNPYAVSKETLDVQFADEGFAEFCKDFLDAYMSYGTTCPCPDEAYAQSFMMVLDYECPFWSSADIDFNWATGYDYFGNSISWTYNVTKDELDARRAVVADAVRGYLDEVAGITDEASLVQTLYHSFCPRMTYDYERLVSREKLDAAYAFTENRGVCITFANAFAQLCTQVGIEATVCSGLTDDGESHSWNSVRVGGYDYLFDTTFELNYKGGNAFVYYGMTEDERFSSGVQAEGSNFGRYWGYEPNLPDVHLNVK